MMTVGQAASDLLAKGDQKQPVIDTQREMCKRYADSLIECAMGGKERYGASQPFYVCVQTKRERLLPNVIRSFFYSRISRPSPAYDLALYWFDPHEERLEFVWCIPDKETVENLVLDYPKGFYSSDHLQLYEFCKGFVEGTLI